jgi:GNAT superfamily N-acetyltransferase
MPLRTAGPDDAPAIAALINRAFAVERSFKPGDRITADEVATRLVSGKFLLLGESGLDACVYLEQRGERAYFGLLAVEPARQGQGLGRRLVAAAEAHARAAGCRHMDLQIVNVRDELVRFYTALGYAECGTAPFPPNEITTRPVHFVRMTRSL